MCLPGAVNVQRIHVQGSREFPVVRSWRVMETQAVVLAGGRGRKLYPFTEDTPKALLPVANRPLLYYPLLYLQNEGFAECLVVVEKESCEAIKMAVSEMQELSGLAISVVWVCMQDSEQESMDSLRQVRHLLRAATVLLLSCDLVCDVPLHLLADVHRSNNAAVTVLLGWAGPPQGEGTQEEEGRKWQPPEQDIFGLEGVRLLFLHREVVGEDEVDLSRAMLLRHAHIQLRCGLADAHMYLMRRSTLEWALDHIPAVSLYDEVVPEIVRRQFLKARPTEEAVISSQNTSALFGSQMSHVTGPTEAEDLEQSALEASSHAVMSPGGLLDTKEALRCFVHVASKEHLCVRVRTLTVYAEINKMLPRSYQSLLADRSDGATPSAVGRGRPQVSSDSLIGQGVSVAEKSSVKKSVVGSRCVLKDRSKVVGSVLMEGVVIGERATVQNCVLSNHVQVGEGATLRDCYIGPQFAIPQGMEAKGETLVAGELH